jgi:glycosyltransferase involved in cell wall biosynthesis
MEMEENIIMKITQMSSVHYENSTRIFYKECITLANSGYDITYIVPTDKDKYVNGVKIKAVNKPKKRFERFVVTLWKIYKIALLENADVYHFHDPELISIGLLLKLRGKKVIYDVHEDYSKQILSKKWIGNEYFRKIVAFLFNIFEQIGVMFFNKVITATPDISRKFPKYKTVVLRNFPTLKLIGEIKPVDYHKNKPIIIYAGGLSRVRGIKEIIQSMEYIGEKADLWLLGRWENNKFNRECENMEGWGYCKYLGFIPLEEVFKYMKIADIGICLLYPVKNYIKSLPIKSFEYMACSLPVIMSNFTYWQEIFEECALFANPYDPKDIAEKILYLLDKPDEVKKLGERGRKLIEEKYSWEEESKKLLNMYRNL